MGEATQIAATGIDTREGSDARQRTTPVAATNAVHQHARDAAADLAYPDEKHGTKTGRIWGMPPVVVIRGGDEPVDLSWNDGSGLCVGMDPDLWFPLTAGRNSSQAKAVCLSGCPLLDACREHGIRHELIGVWGGLSPRERRAIRVERDAEATHGPSRTARNAGRPITPIEHGTPNGALKHRRYPDVFGELNTCDDCRTAANALSRDRKRQARRSAS